MAFSLANLVRVEEQLRAKPSGAPLKQLTSICTDGGRSRRASNFDDLLHSFAFQGAQACHLGC
jgi:hypothetical protein